MDDAEYEKQKARLIALSEAWIHPIGLGWWRVNLSYDRTGEDFFASVEKAGNFRSQSVARCFADWKYGIATILWNMPELPDLDDDELEHTFVHELMHIFLNEVRGEGADWMDHEERVATTLEKAFIWVRDRARDGKWGVDD
jgi:hypothetical protein